MYRVIKFFTDLQDKNHEYNVGDVFPRIGMDVSQKRIEELSGSNNKQHTPLIERIADEKPVADGDDEEERPARRRKAKG